MTEQSMNGQRALLLFTSFDDLSSLFLGRLKYYLPSAILAAAWQSMRPQPNIGSQPLSPRSTAVVLMMCWMSQGFRLGLASRRRAAHPAICGPENELPFAPTRALPTPWRAACTPRAQAETSGFCTSSGSAYPETSSKTPAPGC